MKYWINLLTTFFKSKKRILESEKSRIRRRIRNKKNILSDLDKAYAVSKVFEKIEQLPQFQQANKVLLYWSMVDELATHSFIEKWSAKKQIFLPMVKNEKLLVKPFTTKADLFKSELGIWEPVTQREYLNQIDLVIVPGIAFDRKLNRLGRGKGYYDRYFEKANVMKIGIGYDFQLFENLPTSAHDIKMDKIITPNYTIG